MAFAIAGSTALAIGAVTAGVGAAANAGMAINASSKRKKRERELDALASNSPIYKPSKSIQSYYQEAKNRYQESPYQSQQYQVGAKNIRQAMASGVTGLQDRRSAIGGINRLAGNEANAMQNLAASAEAQRAQRFGQLGQASQAMGGEERMEFDINKQTPYNRKFGLAQYKAQAENERYNKAVAGTFDALGSGASMLMMAGNNPAAAAEGPAPLTNQAGFDTFMSSRGQAPTPRMSGLPSKDMFFGPTTGNLYNYRPNKKSKL